MLKKICVISEKRYDAIGIVNDALINNLKKKNKLIQNICVDNRPTSLPIINFLVEVLNTIKLALSFKREDILLFTDPLSFNTLASLFVKNKKYVIFYHYEKDPFYYRILPIISYSSVLNGFDGIICISNFSLLQLKPLRVDSGKCKVIYCGTNRKIFKPTHNKMYEFEYILSVGSEEPRKNMKNVLKAISILRKEFPKIFLLKVGRVNDKNRANTLKYVKKYGLSNNVIFTDYIEETDLPKIYSGAKLLLFPSLLEGFGLPIVEAMSCGCPVVTSNINPMKELIGDKQITVDPHNPKAIADECKKIIENKEYRENLIQIGLERAKKFDWSITTKEILKYIDS